MKILLTPTRSIPHHTATKMVCGCSCYRVMLCVFSKRVGSTGAIVRRVHRPILTRRPVHCDTEVLHLLTWRPHLQIVAREHECFFLNITADLLRHREYGKTEKVVAAIFSVAAKLWQLQKGHTKRPTIIFMDEIDNILGGKESSHEAYLAARSIFAQKWDGIQKTPGMIVMGTTNYPDHLPAFIYRRFLTRTRVCASFARLPRAGLLKLCSM